MTRSLLPLLLVLSACSEGITLHLGLGSAPVEGFHVHALLGDGQKVISEANGQGDVFLPTSLDAPVDVSVVSATDQFTRVKTVVGVQRPELWLEAELLVSDFNGQVTGKVTGWSGDPADLRVEAYGDALWGPADSSPVPDAASAYSLDVRGHGPGTVDVVALGFQPGTHDLVAAGMVRDVAVGREVAAAPDLALDHLVDRQVTAADAAGAASGLHASLGIWCFLHGREVLETGALGSLPITAPTLAFTGPFDGCGRLGLDVEVSGGHAFTQMPFTGETSVSVPLLGPTHLTNLPAGGMLSRSGLSLTWSADPEAETVEIELTCFQFSWKVTAPAADGRFQFFELPPSVASKLFFPAGTCDLRISGHVRSMHTYQEEFSKGGLDPSALQETLRGSDEAPGIGLQ